MTQPPIPLTRQWVREQIALHKSKLADLEATLRVMDFAVQNSGLSPQPEKPEIKTPIPPITSGWMGRYPSKKYWLLQTISGSPIGLSTKDVIEHGERSGLAGLNSGNVSPQLSDYRKNEEFLTLENGRWKITDKGREYLRSIEKGQP